MNAVCRSALAALCLSFLAACGGGTVRNASCISANDCAQGFFCQASECVAPGQCASTQISCTKDTNCPSGDVCSSGCCVPGPTAGCTISSDCKDAALPHCDSSSHTCKACTNNGECSGGKLCSPRGTCETGCAADTDCTGNPAGTHCFHATTGVNFCGQCSNDTNCEANALSPVCKNGICFGCASDNDCGGTTPACDTTSHKCVACSDAQNGANGQNPRCTGAAKACVNNVCTTCAPSKNNAATGVNGACPASAPVCDANSTCVACLDTLNQNGVNGACTSPTARVCLNKACSACLTGSNDAATGGKNPACAAATPVCADANAGCLACDVKYNVSTAGHDGENAACPAGTKVCKQQGCIECATVNNDPVTGVNASCTTDPNKKVCDVNDGGCRQCTEDAHCSGSNVCSNKVCALPVLADFTPHTGQPFVGTTLTLTLKTDHPVRVATDAVVKLTGEGSLDATPGTNEVTVTIQPGTDTATLQYYAPATVPAAGAQPVLLAYLAADAALCSSGPVNVKCPQAQFTVSNAPLTITALTPTAASVIAFGKTSFVVQMNHTAPNGATVQLAVSTNEGTVPATVAVQPGAQESDAFDFTAGAAATTTPAVITASFTKDDNTVATATANVTIRALGVDHFTPPTPAATVNTPITLTVWLNETTPVAQTVTLAATTGGSVPASVSVPAGAQNADFTFAPGKLDASVTVTATFNGTSKTTTVNVTGQPHLNAFDPSTGSYVRAGAGTQSAFPSPLFVKLDRPAPYDLDVNVASDASVTVANGGVVHFAATDTQKEVQLAGNTQSAATTLTATLNADTKTATVRVLGANEVPSSLSMTPTVATLGPNGSTQFTLTVDIPVAADFPVTVDYGANASMLATKPSPVNIPAGTKTTTFTVVAGASVTGQTNITATAGSLTAPTATITFAGACPANASQVVISQLYGGGGNSGATYNTKYVELHNRGTTPASLGGMSIQYASATNVSTIGTTNILALKSVSIPAGGYYLVGLTAGTTGAALPVTPDDSQTLSPSGTTGKLFLVKNTTALSLTGNTGSNIPAGGPADPTVVADMIGFGGSANYGEGSTASPATLVVAPATSSILADFRGSAGCSDTNNNAADFTAAAPAPRNSSTAGVTCQICGGTQP